MKRTGGYLGLGLLLASSALYYLMSYSRFFISFCNVYLDYSDLLLAISLIFFTLFLFFKRDKYFFTNIPALWIILYSPYNNYNLYWQLSALILFFILSYSNLIAKFIDKVIKRTGRDRIITQNLMISILGFVLINIFFAAFRIISLLFFIEFR